MNTKYLVALIAVAGCISSASTVSADMRFTGLGDLAGGRFSSSATDVSADVKQLRLIAGVFKRQRVVFQVPIGGLGISQMQALYPAMGLGQWAVFVEKTIFKAELEFAFFRLAADQEIYRFGGGNIGQVRLVKINQRIKGLVGEVIPGSP